MHGCPRAMEFGIDEFEGSAIAAQPDASDAFNDWFARENGGEGVVIDGADLGEEGPIGMAEQSDEEHASGSAGLTDGLGLPELQRRDDDSAVSQWKETADPEWERQGH